MQHELFGKLKYKEAADCWSGRTTLDLFAALGTRMPSAPATEQDAEQMLDEIKKSMGEMREEMRRQFGSAADAAFEELDAKIEQAAMDETGARDTDEHRVQLNKRAARRQEYLSRGIFPFRIADPDKSGPRPEQIATFLHLKEHEAEVCTAVTEQIWESFQEFYADKSWRAINGLQPAHSADDLRSQYAVLRVDFTLEHRDGFASLVFPIESDWQDEHGLFVVYSPTIGEAIWTTFEGLDDALGLHAESDGEHTLTPDEELMGAVMAGELDRARELIASGADINAVGTTLVPPLCAAVERLEVEEVRRLLAFGANSKLADPESGRTPLQLARRIAREMGFLPSKKSDPLRDAVIAMARESSAEQFKTMKVSLKAIIQMLKDAESPA